MKFNAIVLLSALLAASGGQAKGLTVLPGSTSTFIVHARRMFTHEVITGMNIGVSGSVSPSTSAGGVLTAHVEIDAAGFKTGDDLRDEHVRGALQAKSSPKITFDLSSLPGFDISAPNAQTLTAQGSFSVGGHSIGLEIPVSVEKQGGHWKVKGQAETSFKALKVTPPGMPVLVSVEDALTVKVDLLIGE